MWYHNCKISVQNRSQTSPSRKRPKRSASCKCGAIVAVGHMHNKIRLIYHAGFACTNSSSIQTWGDERTHKSSQIKRKECQNAKLPRSALTKTKTKRGNARGQKCSIRPVREEPRSDSQVKLYKCAKTIRISYPWQNTNMWPHGHKEMFCMAGGFQGWKHMSLRSQQWALDSPFWPEGQPCLEKSTLQSNERFCHQADLMDFNGIWLEWAYCGNCQKAIALAHATHA